MKPLKVKIVTPNDLLTAGHPVPLRCDAWGSYPPAKIQWLLDGEPIRNADVTASSTGGGSHDGNLTTSILTLKVVAENDGAEVMCRATNPWFSTGALEDKRIINVACKWHRQRQRGRIRIVLCRRESIKDAFPYFFLYPFSPNRSSHRVCSSGQRRSQPGSDTIRGRQRHVEV